MPQRPQLSDLAIRAAKPPERGAATLWDGSLKHFGLRISQGGTKSFIVLLGSGRRHVIGRFPTISLSQARTKARNILAERTLGRHQPSTVSWQIARDEFIADKKRTSRTRTASEYERTLKRYFSFGTTRLADITRQDVARKLDKLANVSSQQAHAQTVAKIFFNWCMARGYLNANPLAGIKGHASLPRSRVLTDQELKAVWTAAEHMGGHFGTITKLLILTGQRRGEIAALRAEYIEDNLCTFPATLTKNKRAHCFPLSQKAQFILKSYVRSASTNDATYLFPARGKPGAFFNGWSKSKAQLDKLSGVNDWTLHDLRRTFATRLASLGLPLPVIERLLNHSSGSFAGVVGVYQRHDYMPEMREAVDLYEKYILSLPVGR